MKDHNAPEVEVKEKKPRPYIHLEDTEIQELISIYRKLLRSEVTSERDLITNKIEILEKELRFRNKLVKQKAE